MRTTQPPCWTTRAETHTSCWNKNHGMRSNSQALYDLLYTAETGEVAALVGRPSQRRGPWGWSIAAREGLSGTKVTQAEQDALGLLRDADDDVQAFTGWWGVELARYDIPVFMGGKWNNPWRVTDPIPAGITFSRMQEIDGGNQYSGKFLDYEGPNPFDGEGVTGAGTITNVNYNRGACTMSWSAGDVRVVCSNHGVEEVGELIYIESTGAPGYVGLHVVTAIEVDANAVHFALATNPGGSGSGTLYVRNQMPLFRLAKDGCRFFEECGDGPGFAFFAPHQTHDVSGGYASTAERQYLNKCDPNEAMYFGGSFGAVADNATDPPTTTQKNTYKGIVEQQPSLDDALAIVTERMRELRPNGDWFVIVVSDGGVQNGEGALWGNANGKTTLLEGSVRPFCYVIAPSRIDPNTTIVRPMSHADLGLTVLDMYDEYEPELAANHMHDDRDGISILRQLAMDEDDPRFHRKVPVYGDWKAVSGESYVDEDNWKWVHRVGVTSAAKKYDCTYPSPYESVEVNVTGAALTTFLATMSALDDARWDPVAATNPANDGSIT